MTISFNTAKKESTFADLFTDTNRLNTWYRLWTGDSHGKEGDYVDTSAFTRLDAGWIKKDHLKVLKPDFAQANDSDLWVQTWNASDGRSDWNKGVH